MMKMCGVLSLSSENSTYSSWRIPKMEPILNHILHTASVTSVNIPWISMKYPISILEKTRQEHTPNLPTPFCRHISIYNTKYKALQLTL